LSIDEQFGKRLQIRSLFSEIFLIFVVLSSTKSFNILEFHIALSISAAF